MIEYSDGSAVPQQELKLLWKKAFGDEQSFIDSFFEAGYAPECCRTALRDGKLVSMLFWFDCSVGSEKIAYIYGVATDPAAEGQGIATGLMENVHSLLQNCGYSGAILVPGSQGLFRFYEKRGYHVVSTVSEGTVQASHKIPVERIDAQTYAQLRDKLLKENAVRQQGRNAAFLDRLACCYRGDGFLAAVSREAPENCMEYLGDEGKLSGLAAAMGCSTLSYRMPGAGRPFAMGIWFDPASRQDAVYFGLAFD